MIYWVLYTYRMPEKNTSNYDLDLDYVISAIDISGEKLKAIIPEAESITVEKQSWLCKTRHGISEKSPVSPKD